jgi:dipeptide/tripeptide permease
MRALPTIVCVTVGFNVCYGGMDVYPIQACQMDCQTGAPEWLNDFFFLGKTKQFNSTFFGLGDNLAIIIMIPLFEGVIWPFMKRMRNGVPVSRKTKFNLGFFFCVISCVVGIILEIIRKHQPLIECPAEDMSTKGACFCQFPNGTAGDDVTGQACTSIYHGTALLVSNCAPRGVPMSQISGWWTFIPFWLTGCGEILVNPVVQEFSYDEVSPRLKSLLMGITMVVMGCIPAVISAGFTGFIPNNLNNGDVNYVFYAYIVVGVLLLFAYWAIALPERVRLPTAAGMEGSLLSRSLVNSHL